MVDRLACALAAWRGVVMMMRILRLLSVCGSLWKYHVIEYKPDAQPLCSMAHHRLVPTHAIGKDESGPAYELGNCDVVRRRSSLAMLRHGVIDGLDW